MSRIKYEIPDWLGQEPVVPDDQISETLEFDIVVCGGGHAGTSVAHAAAHEGASVAVLELQSREEYHFLGEQIGHFNSKLLRDRGVKPVENLEEVVAEFQKRSFNYSNPNLIRKYVYNCGEMVDELMALIPEDSDILKNANVHLPWDHEHKNYPLERGGYKTWAGTIEFRKGVLTEPILGVGSHSNLTEVEMYMVADAEAHGAKWFYETDCYVLTKDGDRVTGVIGKDRSGKYTKYLARKGVALCLGDFGLNTDMVIALLDELRELAEVRGQDPSTIRSAGHGDKLQPWGNYGQGHKLGCWAGGHIENGPRAWMRLEGIGGSFGFMTMLALNCRGERFMDESIYAGMPMQVARQPLGTIVGLSDCRIIEYYKYATLEHGQPDFGRPEYQEQLKEDFEYMITNMVDKYPLRSCSITERMPAGEFYVANTIEELAAKLGYKGKDYDNFIESVKRYNELCRAGRDTDFGKDKELLWPIEKAPFVACKSDNLHVNAGLVTLAGLEVDNNQQVLSEDGKNPIPGLFTSGNNCGGRYAIGYACPVGGNSIGMAKTLGRELGKYMAHLD
ncbi:MAG: FAD-binding protein [Oscillospiraceae bacterium]|jgi:hypothetical protein